MSRVLKSTSNRICPWISRILIEYNRQSKCIVSKREQRLNVFTWWTHTYIHLLSISPFRLINCLLYEKENESIDTDRDQSYIYTLWCNETTLLCTIYTRFDFHIYMINQDRRQSVIFTLELFHSFVLVTMIIWFSLVAWEFYSILCSL